MFVSLFCAYFPDFTLTNSSDNVTVGLDFTFTCVTTETVIIFNRVVTHVKVKSSPTVTLSDEFVSVKPGKAAHNRDTNIH
jgi:hypothetical protein